MTCTGCPHLPHPGACVHCGCAIVTLVSDGCGCGALEAKIDALTAAVMEQGKLLTVLAGRTEYMVDAFEQAHELRRYVDLVAARVAVLEARGVGNGEAP